MTIVLVVHGHGDFRMSPTPEAFLALLSVDTI